MCEIEFDRLLVAHGNLECYICLGDITSGQVYRHKMGTGFSRIYCRNCDSFSTVDYNDPIGLDRGEC